MAEAEQEVEIRAERQEDVKETGRLEAFSDGVFAVAVTLLVFNIPIPQSLANSEGGAWTYIGGQWPRYLAYVLSFVTILIMWSNHHIIFRLVRRTNQLFVMLNGLLLMSITFLNFPTGLLGASLQQGGGAAKVATLVYNGTLIFISTIFHRVWRYAADNGRLLDPRADPEFIQTIYRQYRFGPVVYVLPLLVALLLWQVAIGIDIALAAYFALTGTIRRVPTRKHTGELAEFDTLPR